MTRSITIQAEPVKGAVEEALSSARIYNERLEVRFGEQSYPLVTPSTTVELLINGVKTTERTILGPTDTIECSVLDEEKMTATAVVTVGKRMFRSLRKLIVGAEQLLDLYSEETTPESVLQAEFALNSILYSNGNIHIRSKGVYNCSVTALRDVTIKGVCRGGEVIAGRHIKLDETGSDASVRTFIQTAEEGVIEIGKANVGTVIPIGTTRYEFLHNHEHVTAKLNEDGLLLIV